MNILNAIHLFFGSPRSRDKIQKSWSMAWKRVSESMCLISLKYHLLIIMVRLFNTVVSLLLSQVLIDSLISAAHNSCMKSNLTSWYQSHFNQQGSNKILMKKYMSFSFCSYYLLQYILRNTLIWEQIKNSLQCLLSRDYVVYGKVMHSVCLSTGSGLGTPERTKGTPDRTGLMGIPSPRQDQEYPFPFLQTGPGGTPRHDQ